MLRLPGSLEEKDFFVDVVLPHGDWLPSCNPTRSMHGWFVFQKVLAETRVPPSPPFPDFWRGFLEVGQTSSTSFPSGFSSLWGKRNDRHQIVPGEAGSNGLVFLNLGGLCLS